MRQSAGELRAGDYGLRNSRSGWLEREAGGPAVGGGERSSPNPSEGAGGGEGHAVAPRSIEYATSAVVSVEIGERVAGELPAVG